MQTNSLTNQKFAALANGLPVPLTITFEGTGAGTAWISGNMIFVNVTTVLEHTKYINLTTPIAFNVVNFWSIKGNGTASGTLTLLNTVGAISDAIVLTTADKTIDRATTIDNDYSSFNEDDDDLRVEVGTAAYLGLMVIEIDK